MNDEAIKGTLERVETLAGGYHELTGEATLKLTGRVEDSLSDLRTEVSVKLSRSETALVRQTALLYDDAEFHLLRAYFHASPSLIAILLAIYTFITTVITIINAINSVFKVITGETLAYWIDQLMPGFQKAWNDIMNKVSELSGLLGWGVDGVHHLLNVANTGADLWGNITGKDRSSVRVEKYERANSLLTNYSKYLQYWQKNPGRMISDYAEEMSFKLYGEGNNAIHNITENITNISDKTEDALKSLGSMSSELLAIREGMPEVILKNIPRAIWDSLEYSDTMINDRLLPSLDKFQRRLDEVDSLIDKYKSDMQSLASRIAKPGDLLAEIDALPDYVRKDQEDKISEVSTRTLKRTNEADIAVNESRLREFDKVYDAMVAHTPSPEFLTLESPARAALTGIVAEPRETWLVGDY